MKKSILEKLERLSERLAEIDGLLGGEHAAKDMDSYRKLTRERADITPVVEKPFGDLASRSVSGTEHEDPDHSHSVPWKNSSNILNIRRKSDSCNGSGRGLILSHGLGTLRPAISWPVRISGVRCTLPPAPFST